MALSRIRSRKPKTGTAGAAGRLSREEEPQRLRFSAALPGPGGGKLFEMTVEALSEPDVAGGERLRLRTHMQANFASVLRPALAAAAQKLEQRIGARLMAALPAPAVEPAAGRGALAHSMSRMSPLAQRAGGWLQARIRERAPALLASVEPALSHDLHSWFELSASTSPFAEGAKALLPRVRELDRFGIVPREDADAPPLQSWMGQAGGDTAQISLLRLDDSQLPEQARKALDGKPLQIAAAWVNLARRG